MRALELEPGASAARETLATLLLAEGRSREARDLLREGAADDADLAGLLGAALAISGDPQAALEQLEDADLPPGLGHLLLGQLELEAGSAEEALQALDVAVESLAASDLRAMAFLDRGLALIRLERQWDALLAVRKAAELAPDDLFTLFTLGWLEMDWGDRGEARRVLQSYVDLGGGDDRATGWLDRLGE